MNYKVGDIVRVREDLEINSIGVGVVDDMLLYKGYETAIKSIIGTLELVSAYDERKEKEELIGVEKDTQELMEKVIFDNYGKKLKSIKLDTDFAYSFAYSFVITFENDEKIKISSRTFIDTTGYYLFTCNKCNRIEIRKIDNKLYDNVRDYCNNCIRICPSCGNYERKGTFKKDEETEKYICRTCWYDKYVICDDCGKVSLKENAISDSRGVKVCKKCFDKKYALCDLCGTLTKNVNKIDSGEKCCERCASKLNDRRGQIYGYHEFQAWLKKGKDTDLRYGFELEVENKTRDTDKREASKKCFEIMEKDISSSYDGSLSNGFEIVSHPMTYKYIIKNQNKIEKMLDYLSTSGFRSHSPRTCGLHWHVSKDGLKSDINTIDETIDNVLMIVETFKDELINFSRRTENGLSQWAKFMGMYKDSIDYDYIKKNKCSGDRYVAVNLTNKKTIEFRIFRGTLNFTTFMASIELVNAIIEYAKNNKDIKGLTWSKLIGDNKVLNEYNIIRGIVSTKVCDSNKVISIKEKQNSKKRYNFDETIKVKVEELEETDEDDVEEEDDYDCDDYDDDYDDEIESEEEIDVLYFI